MNNTNTDLLSVGVSRTQELENCLTDLLDAIDDGIIAVNLDASPDERHAAGELIARMEVVLALEGGGDSGGDSLEE